MFPSLDKEQLFVGLLTACLLKFTDVKQQKKKQAKLISILVQMVKMHCIPFYKEMSQHAAKNL